MARREPTDQQYLIYRLYAEFGRAVLEAQRFEINLGVLLFFLEGRKRAVVRKPSDEEIDALFDEIDGQVLGTLIDRLGEFHVPSDEATIELFKQAAANRNLLVHHFMKQEVETMAEAALVKAIERVQTLSEPIIAAKRGSEALAVSEHERMRAEIEQRDCP